MAIRNTDELIEKVDLLMGDVSGLVIEDQKVAAIDQSLSELKWPLPNSDSFQCHWIIERTRRHILYIVAINHAHKFQYKQIRLNQRFDHYMKLIEKMDQEFANAMDLNPGKFPAEAGAWLTEYRPCDFVYDQIGRDLTYTS